MGSFKTWRQNLREIMIQPVSLIYVEYKLQKVLLMLKSETLKSEWAAAERKIEFGSSGVRPSEQPQYQRQPLRAATGTEYRIRSSRFDLLERLLEQTIKWVAASLITRSGPGTDNRTVEAFLMSKRPLEWNIKVATTGLFDTAAPRTKYWMSGSRFDLLHLPQKII